MFGEKKAVIFLYSFRRPLIIFVFGLQFPSTVGPHCTWEHQEKWLPLCNKFSRWRNKSLSISCIAFKGITHLSAFLWKEDNLMKHFVLWLRSIVRNIGDGTLTRDRDILGRLDERQTVCRIYWMVLNSWVLEPCVCAWLFFIPSRFASCHLSSQ